MLKSTQIYTNLQFLKQKAFIENSSKDVDYTMFIFSIGRSP